MLNRKRLSSGLLVIIISFCSSIIAGEYTFSVAPQQSASKTVKIWSPVIQYLNTQTGHHFKLMVYKSIPDFKRALMTGKPDLSYMNPYHYIVFHQKQGYQPLVKAKQKKIKGILVVKKDGSIQNATQLSGAKLAFPSPGAFGASRLTQDWLKQQGVNFTPVYVRSHDSGYLNVVQGRFPASGGVLRTLNNMPSEIRKKLRILHTTKGYTPHAIAAHSRIPPSVTQSIQQALILMDQSDNGRNILQSIKIKGWEKAVDSDWNDIREIQLKEL